MTPTTEKALPAREILLVGPYGVLGTGVLDAAAANAAWRITTAARRPPPTHRPSTALINVDLLDRKRDDAGVLGSEHGNRSSLTPISIFLDYAPIPPGRSFRRPAAIAENLVVDR